MSEAALPPTAPASASDWKLAALFSILRTTGLTVLIIGLSTLEVSTAEIAGVLTWVILGTIAIWLVLAALYVRYQIRKVRISSFPLIRGIEALTVGTVIFVSVFTKAYYTLSVNNPNAFTEPLNYFDAYYFTVTVLATVGFGDIAPVTVPARAVTMLQMVLDLGLLAVGVRVVITEVRRARDRRRGASTD
jgi:hypothetical protein